METIKTNFSKCCEFVSKLTTETIEQIGKINNFIWFECVAPILTAVFGFFRAINYFIWYQFVAKIVFFIAMLTHFQKLYAYLRYKIPLYLFSIFNNEIINDSYLNNINGKTVVLTCADSVLGQQLVKVLLNNGAILIVGCSKVTAEQFIIDYPNSNLTPILLNFASQTVVREFVATLSSHVNHIDVLINNASVELDTEFEVGKRENIDMYLGHAYFAQFLIAFQLIDKMIVNPGKNSRIVMLSSASYVRCQQLNSDFFGRKPANYLILRELSKKLVKGRTNITTYSVQSGYLKTALELCEQRLLNNDQEIEMEGEELLLMPAMFMRYMLGVLVRICPNLITHSTMYCAFDEKMKNESGLHYKNGERVAMGNMEVNDRVATVLFNYSCEQLRLQAGTLHTF